MLFRSRAGLVTNVRWSRSRNLVVTACTFNTFFGGPAPAPRDCTAYYRNFELRAWR